MAHQQPTPFIIVCLWIEILIRHGSQRWKTMLKLNEMEEHMLQTKKKRKNADWKSKNKQQTQPKIIL